MVGGGGGGGFDDGFLEGETEFSCHMSWIIIMQHKTKVVSYQ
jgi:hypothetical protein